jgi:hypothetical protein
VSGTEYTYRLVKNDIFNCRWYNSEYDGTVETLTTQLNIEFQGASGPGFVQLAISEPSSATYYLEFPRFPLSSRIDCLNLMVLPFLLQFGGLSWPSDITLEPVA